MMYLAHSWASTRYGWTVGRCYINPDLGVPPFPIGSEWTGNGQWCVWRPGRQVIGKNPSDWIALLWRDYTRKPSPGSAGALFARDDHMREGERL